MSEMSDMWDRFFRGSKYEAKWRGLPRLPSPPPVAMAVNPFMRSSPRTYRIRRAARWRGEILASLRRAYEGADKIATIASDFSTSPGQVCRLATANGWKPRRRGPNRKRP